MIGNMGYPKLCAFYKDGKCIEPLDAHLSSVAIISKYIAGTLYGALGTEFEKLALVTGLLHDIGKGLTLYQEEMIGFGGHELISALIAYKLLLNRCINLCKEDLVPIVYAILVHHQRQEPLPSRISSLSRRLMKIKHLHRRKELFPDPLVKLIHRLFNEYKIPVLGTGFNCIERTLKEVEQDLLESISIWSRRFSSRYEPSIDIITELFGEYNSILEELSGTNYFKYLVLIHRSRVLSGVLMAADKYVSVVCREERKDREEGKDKTLKNPYYLSVERLVKRLWREGRLECMLRKPDH